MNSDGDDGDGDGDGDGGGGDADGGGHGGWWVVLFAFVGRISGNTSRHAKSRYSLSWKMCSDIGFNAHLHMCS